ncbi:hypothetical protein Bbelb_141450 [Branchiostoma belcheri]|nr:hypothetical protein Bbelb_141450 [Branchiostoma belcheri]
MAEVNRSNWTSAETRCLIGLGNCDRIQSKMETFRKKEAFGDIAEGMKQEGYNRTSKQVQKKIRDLKYSYRRIRNSNSRSGRSEFTTCDTARRRPPQLRREAGPAVPTTDALGAATIPDTSDSDGRVETNTVKHCLLA